MNIPSTITTAKQAVITEKDAFLEIMSKLYDIAKANPKKAALFVLLELYAHSLLLHHLQEIRDIMDLIPFFGHKH